MFSSSVPAGMIRLPPDLALEAAQTVIVASTAQGYPVDATATDCAGKLLVGLVSASAAAGCIYIAAQKRFAALAWRRPTSEVKALLCIYRPSAAAPYKANMAAVAGDFPILAGDELIGASGASRETGDRDHACATEGAFRIRGRLRRP